MRSRPAIVLALLLIFTAALAVAPAAARDLVVAQGGAQAQAQGGKDGSGGGQGSPGAETGAGGQTEGGTSEAGPPWTYQMARISVVLLVALALGIGLIYYRLVAKRQRGEV